MLTEREREVIKGLDDETFQRFLDDLTVLDAKDAGFLLARVNSRLTKTILDLDRVWKQRYVAGSILAIPEVNFPKPSTEDLSMMMADSCPFCGSIMLELLYENSSHSLQCSGCGARGPRGGLPVRLWNDRV